MSLINDALKRAQDSQPKTPPPAPPPPPPVTEPETGGSNGMLIGLLILLAICAFGFIHLATGHKTQTVQTAPPPETVAVVVAETNPPEADEPTNAPPEQVASVVPVTTTPETPIAREETEQFASNLMKTATITNAPLRLQGIIFNSSRPWAIVSGETVFVGDHVRGCRVAEISKYTVTLQGEDGTVTKLSVNQ